MSNTILVDTREKKPLDLSIYGYNQKFIKLNTGDYTLEHLEDILTIERKQTCAELSMCIGKERQRFEHELRRMAEFPYKYLLCEFPYNHLLIFPVNSTIPKKFWHKLKITSERLIETVDNWINKYGIEFVYCENKEDAALALLSILDNIKKENRTVG